jgi:hypothetical protein
MYFYSPNLANFKPNFKRVERKHDVARDKIASYPFAERSDLAEQNKTRCSSPRWHIFFQQDFNIVSFTKKRNNAASTTKNSFDDRRHCLGGRDTTMLQSFAIFVLPLSRDAAAANLEQLSLQEDSVINSIRRSLDLVDYEKAEGFGPTNKTNATRRRRNGARFNTRKSPKNDYEFSHGAGRRMGLQESTWCGAY